MPSIFKFYLTLSKNVEENLSPTTCSASQNNASDAGLRSHSQVSARLQKGER
jgi:hypothetical protein